MNFGYMGKTRTGTGIWCDMREPNVEQKEKKKKKECQVGRKT